MSLGAAGGTDMLVRSSCPQDSSTVGLLIGVGPLACYIVMQSKLPFNEYSPRSNFNIGWAANNCLEAAGRIPTCCRPFIFN